MGPIPKILRDTAVGQCRSDLESWFPFRTVWWSGSTGLYQNELLTGDGGHGLCRAADFSQWGAIIHGWPVLSGWSGETRVWAPPPSSPVHTANPGYNHKQSFTCERLFFLLYTVKHVVTQIMCEVFPTPAVSLRIKNTPSITNIYCRFRQRPESLHPWPHISRFATSRSSWGMIFKKLDLI